MKFFRTEIHNRSQFTNTVDLRGPFLPVRYVNQTNVEIHPRIRARKGRIDIREQLPRQLKRRAGAHLRFLSSQYRVNRLTWFSGHVPVSQCVRFVSIRHHAADGSVVNLLLNIYKDAVTATQLRFRETAFRRNRWFASTSGASTTQTGILRPSGM